MTTWQNSTETMDHKMKRNTPKVGCVQYLKKKNVAKQMTSFYMKCNIVLKWVKVVVRPSVGTSTWEG